MPVLFAFPCARLCVLKNQHYNEVLLRNWFEQTGMGDMRSKIFCMLVLALIAGCTEIPLVLNDTMLGAPLISSTDELARKTIALALGNETLPTKET